MFLNTLEYFYIGSSCFSRLKRSRPDLLSIPVFGQVKTELYRPPELPGLGPIQMSVSAIGEDGVIYGRTETAGPRPQILQHVLPSLTMFSKVSSLHQQVFGTYVSHFKSL